MHYWQRTKQLLRPALSQGVVSPTPAATLQKESVDVASVLWLLLDLCWLAEVVQDAKFEGEFIDSNRLLSCVVLKRSSDECLGEEEATHPEDLRGALFYPKREELHSGQEILNPAS